MELRIISPSGEQQFDVAWVEVETPVGNFVIHAGHAPTFLTLLPHHEIMFQLTTGQREAIMVLRGFIEITREAATVLLNE